MCVLCTVVAWSNPTVASQKEVTRQHALLIGVSSYEDPNIMNHLSVDQQVADLKDVLLRRTHDLSNQETSISTVYYQSHIPVNARDSRVPVPTEATIRLEITRFLQNRARDDQVLIYFTGHLKRDKKNELFLLPSDCDSGMNLKANSIGVAWLMDQLKQSPAQGKCLVIDGFHREGASPLTGENPLQLSKLDLVMAQSSVVNQKLRPEESLGYWFIQAFKGDADGGEEDGNLSYREVDTFVRNRMKGMATFSNRLPPQIQGTQNQSTSNFFTLKTLKLEELVDVTARRLVWALRTNKNIDRVVIMPEFVRWSGHKRVDSPAGGNGYGTLGKSVATDLKIRIRNYLKTHNLAIQIDQKDFSLSDEKSSFRKDEVVVFVEGRFTKLENEELILRTEMQNSTGASLAKSGGKVRLEPEELAEIGSYAPSQFVSSRPEVNQEPKTGVPPRINFHPMADNKWPFRVKILVDGVERTPCYRGAESIVVLNKGEQFHIRVDYNNSGQDGLSERVFLKLSVDGVSILDPDLNPDKYTPKFGEILNSVERRYLKNSSNFIIDKTGQTFLGYYVGTKSTDPQIHSFLVVDRKKSLGYRSGKPNNEIGVITASFYAEDGLSGGGVAPGKPMRGGVEYVPAGRQGKFLGSVKLLHIYKEEMEVLQKQGDCNKASEKTP